MKSLRRMIGYVWPYRWAAFMGLLTVVLPVAMELVVPRMLQVVIDQGIRAADMAVITHGSLVMFGAALVGAIATIGQGLFRAQLAQGIAYDVRNDLFTHIQALSFANLDRLQTGRLMTRLSSDVDLVRLFASAGISLLLRAVLMIIGSVIMMIITDWQLSLLMLVTLLAAGLLIQWVISTVRPLYTQVQQKLSALNTIVQESLAGVHVVKAFVREPYEIDRFAGQNVDFMKQNIRVERLVAVVLPVLTTLTNLGLVAIIWWGGWQVVDGRLSLGELVAFNNYLITGMTPLLLLGNVLTMVSRAEASATRILEVMDTQPLIQTAANPHTPDAMAGQVVFEQVSFSYDHGDQAGPVYMNDDDSLYDPAEAIAWATNSSGRGVVLDRVSFAAEPGQRVALLGATGSGKTTLINLIPRFYDVTGGRVLVDGVDVRDWAPDRLRARIGMVLQQTTLFSGTVRENIVYGRPEATLDEVIAAAKAAQAHDFILAMPQGYDSLVEARGVNLSGGQRQRIAIARALLISPSILIFDDCTSAVDLETEIQIQAALDQLMVGRTTFIIAQRINSVLNADQILVLDSGRIVAQGTHRELLQHSPIYQEIYHSQLGEDNQNGQYALTPESVPNFRPETSEVFKTSEVCPEFGTDAAPHLDRGSERQL